MAGFRWFQVVSGWFQLVLDGFRLLLILVSTINKKLVLCLVDFGSQGNRGGLMNLLKKKNLWQKSFLRLPYILNLRRLEGDTTESYFLFWYLLNSICLMALNCIKLADAATFLMK